MGQKAHEQDVLKSLTDRQYQACTSEALTTLVLAGAGTGKTSTLLGRVLHQCQTGQAVCSSILPLAFAVDAADEIQHRVIATVKHMLLARDAFQDVNNMNGFKDFKDFKARTFHSLGLSIVEQVEGERPSLTTLSESEHLLTFLYDVFTQYQTQNSRYRQCLYRYFTVYEKEGEPYPRRSLNDDYIANSGELRCANFLYLMGIPYIYKAHYESDIYLDKASDIPYRCSFYLPQSQRYIEIWDNTVSASYRQRCRAIHQQYGTRCLFYEEDFSLDESLFFFNPELPLAKSWGRVKALVSELQALLLAFKSQGLGSEQLASYIGDNSKSSLYSPRQRCLLELLIPLYQAYETYLAERGEIDFDGMILKATRYIQQGDFIVPWSDILIDEFQDISLIRLQLIQAIRQQKPDIRLFCVGDDWQTIYQFAGSRLAYIRDIDAYFGETEVIALDKTFRFHQGLCTLSSEFIQRNPRQYQKQLSALREAQESVVLVEQGEEIPIAKILADCQSLLSQKSPMSCMILARFHHQLPSDSLLAQWQYDYPMMTFRAMTIHAAKGSEADMVIVLGVDSGEYGLPSEKLEGLDWFEQEKEDYPYASERRVFYVALTRARERVYLCYQPSNPSCFIEELQKTIPLRHLQQRESVLGWAQAVWGRLVQGSRRLILNRKIQKE